jgi:predicted dehydrogenase
MKRAYLSGLGVMGRRHLNGLLGQGFAIEAFDPSETSRAAAVAEAERRKLETLALKFVDGPSGRYDVAVFSEHADLRIGNLEAFLARARAEQFLLEKPLSSDPGEVERIGTLFAGRGIDGESVFGNFTRRAWPSSQRLKALADAGDFISMTVNGGAYGFGNNGIHHLDYFLFLTGRTEAKVRYARLAETQIPSGRGERFRDFGGEFVVENDRGVFAAVGVPTSSVAPVMTIAGPHFSANIDERTLDWNLTVRKADSTAPVFRTGFDHEAVATGAMDYLAMDAATGLWATGAIALPTLEQALAAHRLLHAVLEAGGAAKPYRYT